MPVLVSRLYRRFSLFTTFVDRTPISAESDNNAKQERLMTALQIVRESSFGSFVKIEITLVLTKTYDNWPKIRQGSKRTAFRGNRCAHTGHLRLAGLVQKMFSAHTICIKKLTVANVKPAAADHRMSPTVTFSAFRNLE